MNRKQATVMRAKLAEIEKRDGKLTPEAVVTEARSERSVLHRMFVWDDGKAAALYRLDQARTLIGSIRYVYERAGTKYTAPMYVRDPSAEPREQGYRSIVKLKSQRGLAHETLVDEFARASSHLQRAYEIARALKFLESEIEEVANNVGALHARVSMIDSLEPETH